MPFLIAVSVFLFIVFLRSPLPKLNGGQTFKPRLSLEVLRMTVSGGGRFNTIWNAVRPLGLRMVSWLRINIHAPRYAKTREYLERSGFLRQYAMEDFIAMKVIASFVACIYFGLLAVGNGSPFMYYMTIAAALGFYYLPDSLIKTAIRRRKERIEREMPMFLNTLAIMTDSGLNLLSALEQQTSRSDGLLADEFRKTLEEIRLGISQVEAFQRMSERCDVPDLSLFLSAIVQGIEKGASGLTVIIREQAQDIWTRRKQEAVALGEKASFKLFFPMLLLVFPALLIFLIGPAVLSIIKLFFS